MAFVELRGRLREIPAAGFSGGEDEREQALEETERDYVALIEAGAEAAPFQAELKAADRQTTEREIDAAALVIRQMLELVQAVAARVPRAA